MKINVPEKYADLYLKALSEKKQLLEAKIEEFKKEIQEIDNHISALTSMPIFKDGNTYPQINWNTNAYQIEWSWSRKIAYYEGYKGKIMTSGEIVDFIMEKEPELDKQKVRSSVSAALSNRTRSGIYAKFSDPISNTTFYGPSEWFTENDQPHIEYLPNQLKDRLLGGS
ncbi:MAG: hypothetical protein NXI20_10630 [bacterium]|nr:hypothetical protein [bacterium]